MIDMLSCMCIENFVLQSIEELHQCGVSEPLAILCSTDMWYRFFGGGEEAYGVEIIVSDSVERGKAFVMTKREAQKVIEWEKHIEKEWFDGNSKS